MLQSFANKDTLSIQSSNHLRLEMINYQMLVQFLIIHDCYIKSKSNKCIHFQIRLDFDIN